MLVESCLGKTREFVQIIVWQVINRYDCSHRELKTHSLEKDLMAIFEPSSFGRAPQDMRLRMFFCPRRKIAWKRSLKMTSKSWNHIQKLRIKRYKNTDLDRRHSSNIVWPNVQVTIAGDWMGCDEDKKLRPSKRNKKINTVSENNETKLMYSSYAPPFSNDESMVFKRVSKSLCGTSSRLKSISTWRTLPCNQEYRWL